MLNLKAMAQNSFIRNVSVLAGGTAFAQALGLIALPFLTRIYTPEEFGALGVFVALLGITTVVASLRYEIAIPLPKSDRSAANLLAVSLVCVLVTTATLVVVTIFFSRDIALLANTPVLADSLWILPFAVFFTGAYNGFQYWATRKKAFKRIARTRVVQSVGGVSTQLLLGYAGTGGLGLIAGQVVSNGAGFLGLGRNAFKEDRAAFRGVRFARMKVAARRYDRFPKFSTFEALTNTAGVQFPMILIASLSLGAEVGYLMLAMRIMQVPMSLVGVSISQVYLSSAVEEHRDHQLADFTAQTISGLSKVGSGPILFAGIIAPVIFGPIFGEQWVRTGELIAWMAPWFVMQFLSSPVSMALHVTNNQRTALILQIVGLTLRVLFVLMASTMVAGVYVSEAYAVSGFLFYVLYLWVIFRVVNLKVAHNMMILKETFPFLMFWVGGAISARFFIGFLV